ncbi:MAG: hypothetical protein ABI462_09350 [Ignavibacteria bacterium]
MEIVRAEHLTDGQWKSYARLCNAIDKKSDPGTQYDWKIIKMERLLDMETLKEDHLTCYLFLENGEAIGWAGMRLLGADAEFMYYALDKVPAEVMKVLFEIILNFIAEHGKNEILSASKEESIVGSFKKAGAEILDRRIFARLYKNDIDKKELQKIVDGVSEKTNYELKLYDTISEEILDKYVDVYNDARVDMNTNNPNERIIEKRNREDVLKKLKWDKGPDDKMFVYALMDNENLAAYCSLFIRVENKHMVDQAGGLTTVARNYRGKNLARFLKAKMYLKMLEEYPDFEFIRTDTYPWNTYMYKINEEMGFKPYEIYTEIKLSKSQIEKFLQT